MDYNEDGYDSDDGEGHRVWFMIFRAIICSSGVVGNLIVIFVILVLREYEKAVTHWYVLQLAIADLAFLLALPFEMREDAVGEWKFSGGMCKAKEAIVYVNYYASVLFLTIMSMDRYVAVCRGFSVALQKFRTKYAAAVITIMIWSYAIFMSIPVILYTNKSGIHGFCTCSSKFPTGADDEQKRESSGCISIEEASDRFPALWGSGDFHTQQGSSDSENDDGSTTFKEDENGNETEYLDFECSYAANGPYWKAYVYSNFIMMFVIPLIIMSVCYCLIAMRVHQSRIRRLSFTSCRNSENDKVELRGRIRHKSAASVKVERDQLKVTFICLLLVFVFVICWLPFHAVHMVKMVGIYGTGSFCANLTSVTILVACMNSAVNPYIYNFIGTRFGQRLRSAAGSVRTSVKKRASALSSDVTVVKYHARKQYGKGAAQSSATSTTKTYGRKSQADSSLVASNCNEETQMEQPLV